MGNVVEGNRNKTEHKPPISSSLANWCRKEMEGRETNKK